jgi:predicted adenylyl cyclase CyaB
VATNLERKYRASDARIEQVRRAAESASIGPFSRMTHRDTYFSAPRGRLKLRVIRHDDGTEQAELIAYDRPDLPDERWSTYLRVDFEAQRAQDLIAALALSLGVSTVVEKTRDVAVWRRTRIHLDDVRDLGQFIELETVTSSAGDASAPGEMRDVIDLLGLDDLEPVADSYGDLAGSAG